MDVLCTDKKMFLILYRAWLTCIVARSNSFSLPTLSSAVVGIVSLTPLRKEWILRYLFVPARRLTRYKDWYNCRGRRRKERERGYRGLDCGVLDGLVGSSKLPCSLNINVSLPVGVAGCSVPAPRKNQKRICWRERQKSWDTVVGSLITPTDLLLEPPPPLLSLRFLLFFFRRTYGRMMKESISSVLSIVAVKGAYTSS